MNAHLFTLAPASLLALLALAPPANGDIFWTGATSADIFDESNWDLSNSSVTVIDPDVTIDDDVWIINATGQVEIPDLPGQMRFQVGDGFMLTIDDATVSALGNDGIGGIPGTTLGPLVRLVDGSELRTFFITNRVHLDLDPGTVATFGGPATPINGSTVDLTYTAMLAFTDETVADFTIEHLNKVTVDDAPAVIGVNLDVVSDGGNGCVVTVIPQWNTYCVAAVNSTGSGALIDAAGTTSVAANDLILRAAPTPIGQPGIFYYGPSQVQLPFGDGFRCVGGTAGTVIRVFPFALSDATGNMQLAFDNTGPSHGQVVSGATLNFQAWYRDPGAALSGFNLSNGLELVFEP